MGYFYDTTETILIEQYVSEYMGPIRSTISEETVFETRIDLLVVDPTPERPLRTIVTCGMGAIPLELPQYLSIHRINRVELVLHMSPEWELSGRMAWPVRLLHWLSRLPLENQQVIEDLAVLDFEPFLLHDNPYRGVILHYCNECHLLNPYVQLPRKDRVIFMEAIPLLQPEMDFIKQHSADEFIRRSHRFLPLGADSLRKPLTEVF